MTGLELAITFCGTFFILLAMVSTEAGIYVEMRGEAALG